MSDVPFRKVHSGQDSRAKMMTGINQLADVVGSTLGAKGRNVILEGYMGHKPNVINDGVSIARQFFFEEPVANMAVQLVKDAAIRTNDLAGDGTTGATVLARAIMVEGLKAIEEGTNPVLLRKQLQEAFNEVEERLKEQATQVTTEEQVTQIATVSVQGKELGQKIGGVIHKIGENGAVTVVDGLQEGVFVESVGGMRIKSGWSAGVMTEKDKAESKFEKPRILVMNGKVEDHEFDSKWLPFARRLVETNREGKVGQVHVPNLVVIAEGLSTRIIQMMNMNKEVIQWVWIKPPSFGEKRKELLLDLCALVGATLVDVEDGVTLDKITLDDLGTTTRSSADKENTILTVENPSDRYLDRVNELKGRIENATDEFLKKDLQERLASLIGGVATIRVSSPTEQETQELKLRLEDAINATRSAMEEGFVAGGGVALVQAIANIKGKTVGMEVLQKACLAPFTQILLNAGYDKKLIQEALDNVIRNEGMGIDVLTDEFVDMKEAGIIDPLKVVRHALKNAVSVAGLLLTSEYAVTSEQKDGVEVIKELFNIKK